MSEQAVVQQKGLRALDVLEQKDLIRAGNEWIRSVNLENELMGHPAVREAAVIAVAHPQHGEKPLAAVALKEGLKSVLCVTQRVLRLSPPSFDELALGGRLGLPGLQVKLIHAIDEPVHERQ